MQDMKPVRQEMGLPLWIVFTAVFGTYPLGYHASQGGRVRRLRVDPPGIQRARHHAHRPGCGGKPRKGFDLDVDDYVTKPFSMPVLLRKIAAVLRRAGNGEVENSLLLYQDLILDLDALPGDGGWPTGRPDQPGI